MFNTIRTTLVALLAATATLGGCATTGDRSNVAQAAPSGGERAAMAATFRYLFANNASSLKANAASYCVGTGTRPDLLNPNPELLAALADVRPQVQAASACRSGDRVTDAAGRPALIFHLAAERCDGTDDCLFMGGYEEANASASSGRYRARWVDGVWQVVPEGPQAIS